jgi:L-ribulose-5-phosphate 3-epimerase
MSQYQISCFFDHILEAAEQSGKTIPEILKLCHEWKISALEINNQTLVNNPDYEKIIQDAGFSYNCLYDFYDWESSTDFAKAKDHIDRANHLNCRKILIVPGFFTEDEAKQFEDCSDYKKTSEKLESNQKSVQIKQMLCKAVQYASEKNITVTIEDFDDKKSPVCKTNQILWYLQNVPGLKWTFDTGNFEYSAENALNSYEKLKSYMANVHTKDRGPYLSSVPTGSGILPMTEILQKIKKDFSTINFSIEHFGASSQLDFLQKSATYLVQNLFTSQ